MNESATTRRMLLRMGMAAAAWLPVMARAQPRVIGLLTYTHRGELEPRLRVFREAMKSHGYAAGRDYVLEARYADGDEARLPALAAELLRLNPQLVLASASVSIRAMRELTATVPIVSLGTGDPVGAGFAQSLARPGGNFTGISNMNVDTTGKLLEFLLRMVPGASRVALLYDVASASAASHRRNAREAAQRLGVEVAEYAAARSQDIDGLFTRMRQQGMRGVVVAATAFSVANAKRIAEAALRVRLPGVSQNEALAEAGLLMTYGSNRDVNYRLAAEYVDRILRGARAGDLPIAQPTEFALTINQRTARVLGLPIPHDMLLEGPRLVD
jgi:putative ABC transport system substrate-binding protein